MSVIHYQATPEGDSYCGNDAAHEEVTADLSKTTCDECLDLLVKDGARERFAIVGGV